MKRRTFLKALAAVGISPALIPEGVSVAVKNRKKQGDRIIKNRLKPLSNTGVGDDEMFCGNEEVLQSEQCLFSVDKNGNEKFMKVLSQKDIRALRGIVL